VTKIERLQKAISDLHGVESTHLRSVPVRETFREQTVWDGVVEVFALTGHSQTAFAYAWTHETDSVGPRYVTVLGVPPINSAQDAVRASIAPEHKDARDVGRAAAKLPPHAGPDRRVPSAAEAAQLAHEAAMDATRRAARAREQAESTWEWVSIARERVSIVFDRWRRYFRSSR
jgi:hypothetical protein